MMKIDQVTQKVYVIITFNNFGANKDPLDKVICLN